tara:strand:+ start:111913 stop:112377 length:465 start_codon:yes stop_codon:yes gene_type:complete
MKKMMQEFREFAIKGNAVEMAIGIMIGAAFTSVVKSLVADVLMPPLGLLLGGVDFANLFVVLKPGEISGPYTTLAEAKAAGAVTINYGMLLNAVISFLLVALVLFFVVRSMNAMRRQNEPEAVETPVVCPECREPVQASATRCPHCTSKIKARQ